MALVDLAEAKAYLRVDTSDEDTLINSLLASALHMCADIARLSDEEWDAITADPTDDDPFALEGQRATMRVAILFALGYLYEHREEANHTDLDLTLRSLLFSVREGAW